MIYFFLIELVQNNGDVQTNAVMILDEFLSNVGRLAKFIEPCRIKVKPKDSIIICSSESDKKTIATMQWNDVKQVHALSPSHPRYNNVISLWTGSKIFLLQLKTQQAARFAAYVNTTQPSASSLFDSQKQTDIEMLKKCFVGEFAPFLFVFPIILFFLIFGF